MQGLIPCVSPLATCPPLCLIVWKIDMWLCIVLDWVRGWVARMGFLLPALSPDPPDLLELPGIGNVFDGAGDRAAFAGAGGRSRGA